MGGPESLPGTSIVSMKAGHMTAIGPFTRQVCGGVSVNGWMNDQLKLQL
jgi:hypothetical protein